MRTMSIIGFAVLMMLIDSSLVFAQSGRTDTVDVEYPRRRETAEFSTGVASLIATTSPLYFGEAVPTAEVTSYKAAWLVGVGANFPIMELGRLSTFGVNATAHVLMNVGASGDGENATGAFDVAFPVVAYLSYGGMQRQSLAWGVQGGLGFNLARRFVQKAWTIAPTGVAEIVYAPKKVYKLRFQGDFFPVSTGEGSWYQTWSVSFVYGW